MGSVWGVVKGDCPECGTTIPENTLACPAAGCDYERKFDQEQYGFLVTCAYKPDDVDDEFFERTGYTREDVEEKNVEDWNARRLNNPQSDIQLDAAYLYRARLNGADLVRGSLNGTNLSGASLERAKLTAATLDRATLARAQGRQISASVMFNE